MYLSRIQLVDTFAAEPVLANMLRKNSYGVHQLLWQLFEEGAYHLFREENSREQLGSRRSLPLYYVLSDQRPSQSSSIFKVESKPFTPKLNTGDRLSFRLRCNPTVSRREEGKKRSAKHDVVMDAKYQHLLQTCLNHDALSESEIYKTDGYGRKILKQRFTQKHLQEKLFSCEAFYIDETRKQFFDQQKATVEEASKQWLVNRGEHYGFQIESVQATGYQWHALMKPGSHRNSGFSSMDYEGVLTVQDVPVFLDMLEKGLGPSKRFGCGLMMIRRA